MAAHQHHHLHPDEPAAVRDGKPCANCTAPGAFELCCGCGETYYCDKACQKQHWKEGGHRLECAELEAVQKAIALGVHGPDPGGGSGGDGGGGSGGEAAATAGGSRGGWASAPPPPPTTPVAESGAEEEDSEHDCPICMANADDQRVAGVDCGMCFACGQMVCGECKPKLEASVRDCPTCRAPFRVSAEESFARLWRLVHDRSPGRHTPRAQFNLGTCYEEGTGVRQDDTEAVKWFRLAAEGGYERRKPISE